MHKKPPKRLSNYKKAVKLEEGLTVARLKGELRFKKSRQGLEKSLREHLGKFIDKIEPLELIATLGLTVIVKTILVDHYLERLKILHGLGVAGWFAAVPVLITPISPEVPQTITSEVADWILAFSIAYCIVKYGGQMLGLLEKGLVPVVGMLIGAV
jgi:hypothetical protein